MELTIGGTVYQFKFGMGFLKSINKEYTTSVEGVPGAKKEVGLRYAVINLMDGDIKTLIHVLDLGNAGFSPRITVKDIEEYIDDEDTDIDALFDQVLDFLGRANATKKTVADLEEAIAKARENQ